MADVRRYILKVVTYISVNNSDFDEITYALRCRAYCNRRTI